MRLPHATALAFIAACAAGQAPIAAPVQRRDLDTAARPYSRVCVEGCKGNGACQACCALDALITWHEVPSPDPFCERSHGCTDAVGRFIYREAGQCVK